MPPAGHLKDLSAPGSTVSLPAPTIRHMWHASFGEDHRQQAVDREERAILRIAVCVFPCHACICLFRFRPLIQCLSIPQASRLSSKSTSPPQATLFSVRISSSKHLTGRNVQFSAWSCKLPCCASAHSKSTTGVVVSIHTPRLRTGYRKRSSGSQPLSSVDGGRHVGPRKFGKSQKIHNIECAVGKKETCNSQPRCTLVAPGA